MTTLENKLQAARKGEKPGIPLGKVASAAENTVEGNAENAVVEEWAQYLLAASGRRQSTVARYKGSVLKLEAASPKPLATLRFADLERFLRHLLVQGLGDSARAGAVSAIRSFYGWLAARGDISQNPAMGLERPTVYTSEAPCLTVGEVKALLFGGLEQLPRDPVAIRNRVLLVVMYMAGLRVSEPRNLRHTDVVWEGKRGSLLIRRAKSAGGDVRQHLDDEASKLLALYLQATTIWRGKSPYLFPAAKTGLGLSPSAVRLIFHQRWEASGLRARGRRISLHILRHSLATHLLRAGADVRQVQQVMRHKCLTTTQRYLHTGCAGAVWGRHHPLKPRVGGGKSLFDLLGGG